MAVAAFMSKDVGMVLCLTGDLMTDVKRVTYDLSKLVGPGPYKYKPGIYRLSLNSPDLEFMRIEKAVKLMDL